MPEQPFPDEDDDTVITGARSAPWSVAAVLGVCVAMTLGAFLLT